MSTRLGDEIDKIADKFNDTSSSTEDLLIDFYDDRVTELEDEAEWPERKGIQDFSTASGTRLYTLSAYNVNNERVLYFKNEESECPLKILSLRRYYDLVADGTSATGVPTHYVPIDSDNFYLYPQPAGSYNISCYHKFLHPTLSATSQYINFNDDRVKALKYAVIADLYEDRDDDRAMYWERRYFRYLKRLKGALRSGFEGSNDRLLPGDSRN